MNDLNIQFLETARKFPMAVFEDRYGHKCSIQVSSTDYEAIWLGINDAEPKILATKAAENSVLTEETCGWVPYPLSDDVLLHTQMYLTREQVGELLPVLQRYFETGKLCP